jgi:hypothetical protein
VNLWEEVSEGGHETAIDLRSQVASCVSGFAFAVFFGETNHAAFHHA